jgi:hypothetical protein
MNKEIAIKAGLVYSGKNFEGEDEYIGTKEQWEKADKLEKTGLVNVKGESVEDDFAEQEENRAMEEPETFNN